MLLEFKPYYSTRSSEGLLLKVSFTSCKSFVDHSFSMAGSKLWNALLMDIRWSSTIFSFKGALKTYLFHKSFSWLLRFLSFCTAPLNAIHSNAISSLSTLSFTETGCLSPMNYVSITHVESLKTVKIWVKKLFVSYKAVNFSCDNHISWEESDQSTLLCIAFHSTFIHHDLEGLKIFNIIDAIFSSNVLPSHL